MRKTIYISVVFAVTCLLQQVFLPAYAGQAPPDGWRYPGESDYAGPWLEFRNEIPEPFHVRADFDGNGLEDDAWILIRNDGGDWGLFVLMSMNDGQIEIIQLVDALDGTYNNTGIELVNPDVYKTACGKGYWECATGEPEEVELKRPAINNSCTKVQIRFTIGMIRTAGSSPSL